MSIAINTLSLRSRVIHAGSWTLGGHAAGQALRLGSNLIMTRILVPEMFGIMSLAMVFMIGLQMMSDLGLRQNILQSKRGNDPVFLNTVWTVQILRGLMIWLFALGLGLAIYLMNQAHWFPVGSVYAEPIVPWVIGILSLTAFLGGFESTNYSTANRSLAYAHTTLVDLGCQIAGLIFMLTWAWVDQSVWALVAGALMTSILRIILSHTVLPGTRNRLHWDETSFHEIFRFGKWVFVSSIIGFLAASGDRLLLGGLTDAATLGMYSIAFLLISAVRDIFAKLISNVALPTLGEVVREGQGGLKHAYYKFRAPIDIGVLLMAGVLFSSGHLIVDLLYDGRYLAAGHMFEILAVSLIEVRYGLVAQCFIALGKPKLLTPILGIRLVAIYGLLLPAYYGFGLEGALWVVSCSPLLTLPLVFYLKHKYDLLDIAKELRVLPLLGVGYGVGFLLVQLVGK